MPLPPYHLLLHQKSRNDYFSVPVYPGCPGNRPPNQSVDVRMYLLWYRDRRNRSTAQSGHIPRRRQLSRGSPRSSSGRSNWGCRVLGSCRVQTGSGLWSSLLHLSCWSWTAVAGSPPTPGRSRMSIESTAYAWTQIKTVTFCTVQFLVTDYDKLSSCPKNLIQSTCTKATYLIKDNIHVDYVVFPSIFEPIFRSEIASISTECSTSKSFHPGPTHKVI